MKRFLVSWPVMLVAVLVASCGKEKSVEEDASQYFIKCKIGSVDKTFMYKLLAHKQDVGNGVTNYSFSANATNNADNFEGIGFTIQLSIPVATGTTYKETDPTTDYFLAGIYNPNTQDPNKIFASRYDVGKPLQITFKELTTTTVSGTFSGKLYLNNSTDPNADSAVISNGEFKMKLQ